MTEQSYAVDVGHPPSALLKAVNPVLGFLLGTPFGGPLRKQFMVLNFTGRKSGKQFKLPVSAHVIDNDLYALAAAAWKYNFRGGAPARVVYDGKTTDMRGELVEDRETTYDLYSRCAQGYDVKRAQRQMGLKFRDDRTPTREEFAEAIVRLKLAAIRFTLVA
ncbi:hypothetical protein A5634_14955 [Mycobacterium asiaticum]|uniref:Nitroreductase family deazaflavin-dependent oxidoreductase n=1 Tax=Mycobacterium asiaticum TaxID=1790 RepID=A0A1A3PB62_MYCAS|nr:hypothetical protein [Mycobacterium asiaticum]OBK30935.1 hypothetical protein A5634_14955 [Mycobacterium asiaticum]